VEKLKGVIFLAIFIILVTTGVVAWALDAFNDIFNFLVWLFSISMTDFGLSPSLEIFIKIATFVVSYALVGLIFELIGLFNSDIMSLVYFVISSIIGFVLSYIIYIIQENIVLISTIVIIALIILFFAQIIVWVLRLRKSKKLLKQK